LEDKGNSPEEVHMDDDLDARFLEWEFKIKDADYSGEDMH
jgi:hypothetical protein